MDAIPLLSPEVVAEVMEDLKQDWFIDKIDEYRAKLAYIWSPPNPINPRHIMIELFSTQDPRKRGRQIPYLNERREHLFYNKATVFYWTQSATEKIGGNGPVILGGVKDKYAKTIPGLLRVHEHICAQVRKTQQENSRALTKFCKPWPDPRYFRLHPICKALIVVFDDFKSVSAEKHTDGLRHYDDVAQNQSIILVRTGHENGLSALISFESLMDKCLPLARSEDMGVHDVIRVPLQVGVHFVASLLLREEAAFPESVISSPPISMEPDHPFMKWDREAHDYGENRLAQAQAQGKIEPFATAATVLKNVVLLNRFDIYHPEHYTPVDFKLGWI
ncbi:hypothetical protein F5884DRAFT_862206 [Xylogone sp. PMI_703]|nr:hypothetical protein F5884DRAFT_862206 [Xylogone sp. PMI_703]